MCSYTGDCAEGKQASPAPEPEPSPSSMNSSCACVFPFKYNGRTYSDCTHVDHTQLWCPQKVNSKGEWAPPMAWGECATVCPRPCKSHGNCDARHYCGVQGKGKPPNCESCHFCAGRRDGVGGTCPTKCHGASAWDNVLVKDCNGHQSPASWVGDGVCDAKTFDHGGVKVDMNCSMLRYDGWDCKAKGSGSGTAVKIVDDCLGHPAPASWLGDGKCDDGKHLHGKHLVDLSCAVYHYDGGDCGDGNTKPPAPAPAPEPEPSPSSMNASCACVFPFNYKNRTFSDCTNMEHTQVWCATKVDKSGEMQKYGDCAKVCKVPCSAHVNCDSKHYCATQKSCEPCHYCTGSSGKRSIDSACPKKCAGASPWDNELVQDCTGVQVPKSYLGDGVCDAGLFEYFKHKVSLNCSRLSYDAGDCKGKLNTTIVSDCQGKPGPKAWLGDGKCDDGKHQHGAHKVDFNCAVMQWDHSDCK